MIVHDKKKVASLILSKMGPDGVSKETSGVQPEEAIMGDESLMAIAQDALAAFKSGSAHGVMEALKAFHLEMENREEPSESEDAE